MQPVAIITGSGGLIGSECVRQFVETGFDVVGLDNDMRARFFGFDASTLSTSRSLLARYGPAFRWEEADVRDAARVNSIFSQHAHRLELVVHAAGQPSHDWAASDPQSDFAVNALGTLNLLEATRRYSPDATFIFCSTNKVYGDRPNGLPLIETETRLELPSGHPYHEGIDTSMSIDGSLHSLFGVSKASGDLLTQEYGRYFGIPTGCFRNGCVTGAQHAATRSHGFLAYLMRCAVSGQHYTVNGYRGKQVRDNLHASDVVSAFAAFHATPRAGALYNLGGGRQRSCSVLEAITLCEETVRRPVAWTLSDVPRVGDHRWWISDLREFEDDYPAWVPRHGLGSILREINEANSERWEAVAASS